MKQACSTAHGQNNDGILASIRIERARLSITLFEASAAPSCSGVYGAELSVRI